MTARFALLAISAALCLPGAAARARPKTADACSAVNIESAPPCPTTGATVLDETYPSLAYSVSIMGSLNDEALRDTEATIAKILGAQPDATIFMPMDEKVYQRVLAELAAQVGVLRFRQARRHLVRLEGGAFRWQQDYFGTFFDPDTGRPVMREIQDYGSKTSSDLHRKTFASAARACHAVSVGGILPPLPEPGERFTFDNSMSGGNIGALPGGFCLHGADQPQDQFARYYCGSAKNSVTVDLSWLKTPHIDEVFATLKVPGRPAPCNFVFEIASPDKALELFAKRENQGARFLSPEEKETIAHERDPAEVLKNRWRDASMMRLCAALQRLGTEGGPPPAEWPAPVQKATFLRWLLPRWASAANPLFCPDATNGEVVRAIRKDQDLAILNAEVQLRMNKLKDVVRAKLKEKPPACAPDFVDVPMLFSTNEHIDPASRQIDEALAYPILPAPVNHLSVNGTVISPELGNAVVRDYLKDSVYMKYGIKHETVDTFDTLHGQSGNIHCATHSFHYCAPRAAR